MNIVKFAGSLTYALPQHDGIIMRQLQGGEASSADFVLVGHATFPPCAGVPMGVALAGMVYVVAIGELTVAQSDDVRHVLTQGDSVFVPANEASAVLNDSGRAAALIVITLPQAK